MIKIIDAILAIDSSAEVTVRGEDITRIEWPTGNPNNITVEQIQAKQAELEVFLSGSDMTGGSEENHKLG